MASGEWQRAAIPYSLFAIRHSRKGKGASMKSVVVTGSSTGIGWGAARVLIKKGFRVFGSVRKAADGERLAKELGPNFVPLLFDVTDQAAVGRAAEQVSAALGG